MNIQTPQPAEPQAFDSELVFRLFVDYLFRKPGQWTSCHDARRYVLNQKPGARSLGVSEAWVLRRLCSEASQELRNGHTAEFRRAHAILKCPLKTKGIRFQGLWIRLVPATSPSETQPAAEPTETSAAPEAAEAQAAEAQVAG